MRSPRRAFAAPLLALCTLVVTVALPTSASGDAPRGAAATADDTRQVVGYGTSATLGPTPSDLGDALVQVVSTPSGDGYWLVTEDGGVLVFGDAVFHGSLGDGPINRPVVAMAATPSGAGYWIGAGDGGIFTFGDAPFHGSLGATPLNQPIVGMAPTPTGQGYWLVAADGGIFTFGDAPFHGSLGATPLNQPIVGMAPTPTGQGYWLVAADGGIFTFGDAPFDGSLGATPGPAVAGMAATASGAGYWLFGGAEGLAAFGDAPDLAGAAAPLDRPVWGGAARPDGTGAWLLVAPAGGVLPGGGRRLFPDHLLVAHYGHPGSPILGVLGEQGPTEAAARVAAQAAAYRPLVGTRTVVPTMEIIATLALASPGPEGLYSRPIATSTVQPWLDAVRAVDGMLVLDIQPGRADPLDEARRYESLLVHPDVGLALDPEWTVGPTERPGGGRIGSMDAEAINRVSAYLADLVARHDLPEKVLVIHRFTEAMVTNADAVLTRPGVAIVFHADGFGGTGAKLADYRDLLPSRFSRGIKLFFDEDPRLFTPQEVVGLEPQPDVVTYQ